MTINQSKQGMQKLKRKTTNVITILSTGVASLGLLVALLPGAAAASPTTTVYDATPNPLPANVASLGFEATSTSEFGDYVHLAGANRNLDTVTVTMSDWAQYSNYASDARYSANSTSWTHPITVNIYSNHLDANGTPDTLIATKTQTVTIPWRPAGDPSCPDTGYGAGFAYRASDGQCYNGKAFNATFDMSSLNKTLPSDVIVGIAYDTADYGANPIHQAGPYNSLNVAVPDGQTASVGSDDNADNVYWDSTYSGRTAGFRQDTAWAPNGTVALKITATADMPTSKDQCKDNGWKTYGSTFKNQGDCVSFIATNGKDQPSGH